MTFFDASVDDPGQSPAGRSMRDVVRAPRRSFVSRLMSRASATYCAVCGEELSESGTSLSSTSGRYCVEDHSLGTRK
jgi:hypothetical protein